MRTNQQKYRAKKPIYEPAEDSLNNRFKSRLEDSGWKYKPKGNGGKLGGEGGNWVPPGYVSIPRNKGKYQGHGKTLTRQVLEQRAKRKV